MKANLENQFAQMVENLLQDSLSEYFDSGVLHGFLGIASESGELLDSFLDKGIFYDNLPILIELSDLLHFTQMILGRFGVSLSAVVRDADEFENWKQMALPNSSSSITNPIAYCLIKMVAIACELLNRYKKFIYYHGESFTEEEILGELTRLVSYILRVLELLDSSLEEVIEINIAKLQTRYPNGYTHENAITQHRDKSKELEAVLEVYHRYHPESN